MAEEKKRTDEMFPEGAMSSAAILGTQDSKDHKREKRTARAAFVLPISVPLSKGVLLLDERMCGGCENCVYACSLHNEGVAAPSIARIRMSTPLSGFYYKIALQCNACNVPIPSAYDIVQLRPYMWMNKPAQE
jgi:Na+-translocating ferredoxin:NAD+ oxidoreductase RNF subunit RnfB